MVNVASNTDETVATAVVASLRYYSLFHYPLKADEIFGNMPTKCAISSVLAALEDLEQTEKIYKYEGYYSIDPDIRNLVLRRKAANKLAENKKLQAIKVGKFISNFPFVKFIGISGSLSKGYADPKSDFDFFIVTQENRLWMCRTLLHLFKKLTFLFAQQNKFCMNYFIDMHNLEIEEKNCFTAIELSSLIPVSGSNIYHQLMANNLWIDAFLPNGYIGFSSGMKTITDKRKVGKQIFESFFNLFFPGQLNKMLMRLTDKKWRRKWAKKNYPMEDYDLAFKTTLHISKNHPANYQKKILKAISKFEREK
jgi:hypothetical protein